MVTAMFGLRLGIDFRGGSVLELEFHPPAGGTVPATEDVRTVLRPKISDFEMSPVGDRGFIIRTHELTEPQHQEVLRTLNSSFPAAGISERQFNSIGPVLGNELKNKSIVAIILVLLAVIIYIAFVFRKIGRTTSPWAMGLAAIIALVHDVIIPTGVFAILGRYYGVEITAVFLAAALTILGFSVSDTVVIFDRVRENILRGDSPRVEAGKGSFGAIVHRSVMQTLTRSLNTVFTVLLSLFAIYFFGGESIKYFSLALIVGIFLGAYSSIFVASPLLVWLTRRFKST